MRARPAALLGALHGAAELVPVSSSAHVALAAWLAGVDDASGARRKELEVLLHAGTGVALAWVLARPGVTAPIVGTTQLANLQEILGASFPPLPPSFLVPLPLAVSLAKVMCIYGWARSVGRSSSTTLTLHARGRIPDNTILLVVVVVADG